MATVSLSNQSFVSCYINPSVGKTIDWATGRDYLEGKLSFLVNGAVSEDSNKMSGLRTTLFADQSIQRVSVPTKDGLTLDGALFKSEKPAKGAIFFIMGSGGYYEKIADTTDGAVNFIHFFKNHVGNDIDILVVNPRGVGESKGAPSYQGWVSDMRDGIQFLLDKNHNPQNILVYGHSFGGWIGADAVKHFKDQNKAMPIASDRAFSNFADEVFDYVGGGAKGYAAYTLATYAKWNANIEKSWHSLDKSLVIHSPDDQTVKPAASLFEGLKKKGHFKNDSDNRHFEFRGGNDVHKRAFTEQEKAQLGPRLRQMMQLDS